MIKKFRLYCLYLVLDLLRKCSFRGRARIISAMATKISELQSFPVSISPNTEMKLDCRDDAAIGIFLHGGLPHESGLMEIMSRFLKPHDVFYDIGANHGYYTSLFSEPAYGLAQVVAFEPNPWLAKRIKRNVASRSNVVVMAVGLSAQESSELLNYDARRSDTANFRPGSQGISVEARLSTLDTLLQQGQIRPANVVKIDVEGFEYKVLQGYTLRDEHQPAIFMEWIDAFSAEIGITFEDLQLLMGNYWVIYRIENTGKLREDSIEKAGTTNDLLLVRRDSVYNHLAKELIKDSNASEKL